VREDVLLLVWLYTLQKLGRDLEVPGKCSNTALGGLDLGLTKLDGRAVSIEVNADLFSATTPGLEGCGEVVCELLQAGLW
jgi:hypothetical protein